jgi:hypothetical protein
MVSFIDLTLKQLNLDDVPGLCFGKGEDHGVCDMYVIERFASILDLTFEVKYGSNVVSHGHAVYILLSV